MYGNTLADHLFKRNSSMCHFGETLIECTPIKMWVCTLRVFFYWNTIVCLTRIFTHADIFAQPLSIVASLHCSSWKWFQLWRSFGRVLIWVLYAIITWIMWTWYFSSTRKRGNRATVLHGMVLPTNHPQELSVGISSISFLQLNYFYVAIYYANSCNFASSQSGNYPTQLHQSTTWLCLLSMTHRLLWYTLCIRTCRCMHIIFHVVS